MNKIKFMTIERHILEAEKKHPEATGEFSGILTTIALAAKIISYEINKAGLVGVLGFTEDSNINVHGERVKKLDIYSHDILVKAMEYGGHLCIMASEEEEGIIHIPKQYEIGKYVLMFDPLDGSSNIDANVSIGTIFSIYKRVSKAGEPGTEDDVIQKGVNQVAAGYVLYGSSTILVYTTGEGVFGFTLDQGLGEFLLSHPNITTPKKGNIYSTNEGYYKYWHPGLKKYIKHLQDAVDRNETPYSGRYIGSLVADIHRNLLYGGIFIYPADSRYPDGKLRLMYECNPMAFIVEAAGGRATDGKNRIMEINPTSLHQRCPLYIGSEEDVLMAEKFLAEAVESVGKE